MKKYGFMLSIALLLSLCFGGKSLAATPNDETRSAVVFLRQYVAPEDKEFVRFFSTYAVKPEKRNDTVLALTFVMHSLIGPDDFKTGNRGTYHPLAKIVNNEFVAYRKVPESETLWWFDLRDFNWTIKAWETVALQDGYFVEPIVDHNLNALLRVAGGNAIVRADWFITHATDSAIQQDRHRPILYDTLLYAKTKIPKDGREWGKLWGFAPPEERFGQEYSTVTANSKVVSKTGERLLKGNRTGYGYGYQTYDAATQEGKKDYIEELFTHEGELPDSDAGEMFASNVVGLQVYAVRDKNFKLIHVADPAFNRNNRDPLGDVRVRVGQSCMDCHSHGPIPTDNVFKNYVDKGGKIAAKNKQSADKIKALLLNNNFEDSITTNQNFFAQALLKTNGLTPVENNKAFTSSIVDYNKPVTLEQAAFECGVPAGAFKDKLSGRVSGRLGLLLVSGEPIPRSLWESPTINGVPSPYQQAMINLYDLRFEEPAVKVVDLGNVQIVSRVSLIPPNTSFNDDGQPLRVYNITLENGVVVKVINTFTHSRYGDFIGVTVNDTFGWIPKSSTIKVQ